MDKERQQYKPRGQLASSLRITSIDVAKTDPTLILQDNYLVPEKKEFNGTKKGKKKLNTGDVKPQEIDFLQEEELTDLSIIESRQIDYEELDLTEGELTEQEVTLEGRKNDDVYGDYDEDDEKEEKFEDLDVIGMHLKEIGSMPIQRGMHYKWGDDISAAKMALKALSTLSESDLATSEQKEKISDVLKRGKYLHERLKANIKSTEKRIKLDKYKVDKDRDLDREFVETVVAHEELVNIVFKNYILGIEEEDERYKVIDEFISRRVGVVDQGLESWNNLVSHNLRLSPSIAKQYLGRGLSLGDLIGYGHEGILQAAADYNTRRKTEDGKPFEFSTFAVWWIKQRITRAIEDYGSTIRIPVHLHTQINKERKALSTNFDEAGRQPDLPVEFVILQNTQNIYSLDEPIEEDEKRTLNNVLDIPSSYESPEESADITTRKEVIDEVLGSLGNERESRIIQLRFGLFDGRSWTLQEVGREFGLTRERIRQIEAKALKKLRHPSRARLLRDFLSG